MKRTKIVSVVMASAMLLTNVPSSVPSVFAKSANSSIQVTSETSSEDDIKVDSSSNDISVTDGDSDIVVKPEKSTEDISVDDTENTSKSTAEDSDNTNVTIESEFTSSIESKEKDKLSVGDTAKLHVKAENKSADTASLKLYFSDTDTQLTADKMQWSGYLTKPAMSMSIKGLNKECMLSVPVKTQDDKTIDTSLKFLKEVKNDVVLSRYAIVELPAGTSTEFDIIIANTNEGSVSVIPVMEQKSVSFGDAATLTWKSDDGITIMDKIANTITDKSDADDIQISDVQGAEKTVDDVDKSDFASKRLVAVADDKSVFTDADKVIGQYDNIYLLQYDTVKDAKDAYARLKAVVTAVEPDKNVTAASNTELGEESTESNDDVKVEDTKETDVPNAISALNDMDVSQPVQKEKGVIALIDTGVSESDNVIDRVSVIDDTLTGNGHGDKMLSDILSQDKDAKILSIRAMNDNGFGTISSLVAAMEYAIDQKVDYINLSLYARTTLTTSVLEQEIIKATKAGIVVIGAAGNDGADVKDYVPGSVMEAYIIGAAKEDGTRQTLSNFGDTVDYNVVADSTSDATALFTGYVSKNGLDAVADVLNNGLIYATNYKDDGIDFDPIADDVDFSKYKVDRSKRFLVRYTFADASKLSDDVKLDDLFATDEGLDSMYGVFVDEPDVYDVGDGTYKIKANVPILNGYATHDYIDYAFARGNDNGQVVSDGVSLDKHTGIITVTADAFKGKSDTDFADLQAQILITENGIPDRVIQNVTVEDKTGATYSYKVPYYGLQSESVPLSITGVDAALTSDDFKVYLNGSNIPSNGAEWNEDEHMLRMDGTCAAVVSSLRVVIDKKFDAAFQVAVSWDAFIGKTGKNETYNNLASTFYLPDGTDVSGLTVGKSTSAPSYVSVDGYGKLDKVSPSIGTMYPFNMESKGYTDHGGVDGDWGDTSFQIGIPRNLFGISFICSNSSGADYGEWASGYNKPINGFCHHVSATVMKHQERAHDVFYKVLNNWQSDDGSYTYVTILCMTKEQIYKKQTGGGVFSLAVKNKPKKGGLSVWKYTGNRDITNGNTNYSLEGAKFNVYKQDGTYVQQITTSTTEWYDGWYYGVASTADDALDAGWYYVQEASASPGYDVNSNIAWVNVVAGQTARTNYTYFSEPPKTGSAELDKKSDNPSMTDNNNCYSLAGAVYGIWKNASCSGDAWKSMTTDAKGNAKIDGLPFGNYWVKEITPSKGFALDKTIYPISVTEANPKATIHSVEPAENDPLVITINKIWNGEETPTVPSLAGTQFTVKYFDNMDKNTTGTPKKTWVLEVQKQSNGKWRCSLQEKYLVKDKSDSLYKDPDTGKALLPYGTYSVQETQHAPGYTFEGTWGNKDGTVTMSTTKPYVAVVDKNTTGGINLWGGNEYTGQNKPHDCSIKIRKVDEHGRPLDGVQFTLKNSKGEVVLTKTSGSDGYVTWDKLYPDIYTVTEIKTANGKNLLAEDIEIKLPMRFTEEDIKKYNIDRSKLSEWDKEEKCYYLFDVTYEVSNDVTFTPPMTGAMITAKRFIPIACGMVVLMGATCIIFFKRKKKRA